MPPPPRSTLFPYTTLFRSLWSEEGWRWRESAAAEHPVYWKREGAGRWLRRDFNCWVALEPHRPVLHVNWKSRRRDRKSTRLNSSHVAISYAVFCLKKKKNK